MSNNNQSAFASAMSTSTSKEASTSASYNRRARKQKDTKAQVKDNPFYKAVTENASPKKQKEVMVELMTFTDKETSAKNAQALEEFKSYLQEERQRVAQQIIQMTDTKNFSNLQSTLNDINNDMLDFEEAINPFMNIISSISKIQEAGATTDLIAELRKEGEELERIKAKVAEINRKIKQLNKEEEDNKVTIALCQEDRSFFGFGGVKQSSQEKAAKLGVRNQAIKEEVEKLLNERKELQDVQKASTQFENLSAEKEVLANMLDLSKEETEQQHKDLVEKANNFVNTTQARVNDTLQHSETMGEQIGALADVSFGMRSTYTILSEASKEAKEMNNEQRTALEEATAEMDDLEKLESEEKLREMSKFVEGLNNTSTDTATVLNDLTISSHRIESLEAANKKQIQKTKAIATSGIAGVAENLSTVMTTVGAAATGQATQAASQSLKRMNKNTQDLAQGELIRMAKELDEDNAELIEKLENLASYGETVDIANDRIRDSVAQSQEILGDLVSMAQEVGESVNETVKIHADVNKELVGN